MTFSKDRRGDEELKARFGDSIRHRRHELGISQDELAVRSGLNRSYITEVETGKRNVALVNIGRLAYALDSPLSELFLATEHEDEEPQSAREPEASS